MSEPLTPNAEVDIILARNHEQVRAAANVTHPRSPARYTSEAKRHCDRDRGARPPSEVSSNAEVEMIPARNRGQLKAGATTTRSRSTARCTSEAEGQLGRDGGASSSHAEVKIFPARNRG